MELKADAQGAARLHVENVGGIDETDVSFEPGVTVLAGRNASNRTSLLQAIMAGFGSDRASLKADAEAGRVELELDGETYTRTLERTGDGVAFGGDPYATDTDAADAFAFLLESNEARRAVARGDDLREVIMGPVDTDAIDAEVDRLGDRKRELESELDERDRLESRVHALESELEELESRLASKREAYEAKRIAVEEADAELEQSKEREAELEAKLADLQSVRSSLETVRYRLGTQTESADRLREELEDVEASLSEHADAPADELDELAGRIDDLRGRKRELDSTINQLQSLIQFNEEMLDGAGNVLDGLGSRLDDHDGHVTSQLVDGGEHVCWTCGQATTRGDVEDTLEELRDARKSLVADRRSVTTSLEDAQSRRDDLRERERERSRLESRREDLQAQLADAESEIESLRERRESLESELAAEEAAVEDLREGEYEEIVALHREANELELAVGQLEDDVAETRADLEAAREQLDRLEDVEAELETVTEDLAAARTRIERLEQEAVESFNDHMDRVLEVLGYENVDRIWIERTEREVREGRRTVTRGFFDLHVVRSTPDGTVYEDSVQHLSESEREVTGLVFALAGYLAHEIHDELPFVLLDSVEAIDSERIAALVEYLSDVAGYLVVALLPEDAAPVDDDHPRISDI